MFKKAKNRFVEFRLVITGTEGRIRFPYLKELLTRVVDEKNSLKVELIMIMYDKINKQEKVNNMSKKKYESIKEIKSIRELVEYKKSTCLMLGAGSTFVSAFLQFYTGTRLVLKGPEDGDVLHDLLSVCVSTLCLSVSLGLNIPKLVINTQISRMLSSEIDNVPKQEKRMAWYDKLFQILVVLGLFSDLIISPSSLILTPFAVSGVSNGTMNETINGTVLSLGGGESLLSDSLERAAMGSSIAMVGRLMASYLYKSIESFRSSCEAISIEDRIPTSKRNSLLTLLPPALLIVIIVITLTTPDGSPASSFTSGPILALSTILSVIQAAAIRRSLRASQAEGDTFEMLTRTVSNQAVVHMPDCMDPDSGDPSLSSSSTKAVVGHNSQSYIDIFAGYSSSLLVPGGRKSIRSEPKVFDSVYGALAFDSLSPD